MEQSQLQKTELSILEIHENCISLAIHQVSKWLPRHEYFVAETYRQGGAFAPSLEERSFPVYQTNEKASVFKECGSLHFIRIHENRTIWKLDLTSKKKKNLAPQYFAIQHYSRNSIYNFEQTRHSQLTASETEAIDELSMKRQFTDYSRKIQNLISNQQEQSHQLNRQFQPKLTETLNTLDIELSQTAYDYHQQHAAVDSDPQVIAIFENARQQLLNQVRLIFAQLIVTDQLIDAAQRSIGTLVAACVSRQQLALAIAILQDAHHISEDLIGDPSIYRDIRQKQNLQLYTSFAQIPATLPDEFQVSRVTQIAEDSRAFGVCTTIGSARMQMENALKHTQPNAYDEGLAVTEQEQQQIDRFLQAENRVFQAFDAHDRQLQLIRRVFEFSNSFDEAVASTQKIQEITRKSSLHI
jgi:hypothetical protein